MEWIGARCLNTFTHSGPWHIPAQNGGKEPVQISTFIKGNAKTSDRCDQQGWDPAQHCCEEQGRCGEDERAPNTSWDSLPEENAAMALCLHRTWTKENLHQHVPRGALPHPNTQEWLDTPPRCSTEAVLLHYHVVPGPASAGNCPCTCMDLFFTSAQRQTYPCSWCFACERSGLQAALLPPHLAKEGQMSAKSGNT